MTQEKTEVTAAEISRLVINFTGIDLSSGSTVMVGLVNEKLTIGAKSRIQKIVKLLEAEFKDYLKLHSELLKKHGAIEKEGRLELLEGSTEFSEEFQELLSQKITLGVFDKIDFKQIENIETTSNYNLALLSPRFIEGYGD